jgi:cytochrome c
MSLSLIRANCLSIILLIVVGFSMSVVMPNYLLAKSPENSAFGKYVDAKGNIRLPENFATDWTFTGTWAITEEGAVPDLHNVYMEKWVIEHYRKNKTFPDGATIIKEVRHARGADHTTGQAHWVTDVKVWFVMVRDKTNRFPDNPLWGDGWGWALFNGDDRNKQVATNYKSDCLGCHIPAKKNEWIYVYAYPLLGMDAVKLAPAPDKSDAKTMVAEAKEAATSVNQELVAQGSLVFKRCAACHSKEEGKNRTGPSLWKVFGRKAGLAAGYNYSEAMKKAEHIWNAETLDKFLTDVPGFIPGNRMGRLYRRGLPKEEDRRAVIEYLKVGK